MMEWGISFLDELQKMKEKIDRAWGELFEENPGKEQEAGQWIDKLPKFEGIRRTSKSRPNKTIRSF